MAKLYSRAFYENRLEDVTESLYDGWEAIKSCSAEIMSADSANRISTHADRVRLASQMKNFSETLTKRYRRYDHLHTELERLSQGSRA